MSVASRFLKSHALRRYRAYSTIQTPPGIFVAALAPVHYSSRSTDVRAGLLASVKAAMKVSYVPSPSANMKSV
jgi:hypothetical protein